MTPSVSFEFFPPRTVAGEAALLTTASLFKGLAVAFVSMTFGAGGSTRGPTAKAVTKLQVAGYSRQCRYDADWEHGYAADGIGIRVLLWAP